MTRQKTVLVRVATAPHVWFCDVCGGRIEAGEQCGKQGKKKLCKGCIEGGKRR